MPGYSNKPLKDKLGLKVAMRACLINPPTDYFDLLGECDVTKVDLGQPADFIHAFYVIKNDLAHAAVALEKSLADKGMLWVSWPKKSSGVASDLSDIAVRDIMLTTGLVDIKVAAVTEMWSGLKFVRRVKH